MRISIPLALKGGARGGSVRHRSRHRTREIAPRHSTFKRRDQDPVRDFRGQTFRFTAPTEIDPKISGNATKTATS